MTTLTIIFLQVQILVAAYLLLRERKRLNAKDVDLEIYTKQQVDASREFFAEDLKNTIGVTHNIAKMTATSTAKSESEKALVAWLKANKGVVRQILGGSA